MLHTRRIEHSVEWLEALEFAERIVRRRNFLTIRPLSNARLKVFQDMVPRISKIMEMRSRITVNSNNRAYCSGCVNKSYQGLTEPWDLSADSQGKLAQNSFLASFFGNAYQCGTRRSGRSLSGER